jgi:4-hydroxy-tetrahydrodipicolinate synthase
MLKPYGIIPAMVTPLTADDEIDAVALRGLTNYLIDGGCHGLFAVGSQGEFWALAADEKRRVWETVVEETAGRVPVYAGTAAVATREAVALTRMAEEAGVDAVSVLTPFFVSPNEAELFDHYRAVAEATSLPVLLYGNPARTGVKISPRLLARLAEISNVVGIKDSSGDLQLTAEYVEATANAPDFAVLMGRDTLIFGGLAYGALGAIAATANVVPELVVDIYERFQAGDMDAAREAQAALAPLRLAFTWGTFPVVVKEALDLVAEHRGWTWRAGPARAPVGPMPDDQRERLRSVLQAMGVLRDA